MEKVKDHLLNVITDNKVLAQIFILLFFLEDYQLIFKSKSIFNSTFKWDAVEVQPVILFFVFIALGKLMWFLWHFLLVQIKLKLGLYSSNDEVYKSVSVLSFLLGILLFTYFVIIKDNESLFPISNSVHPFWSAVIKMIIIFPTAICMLLNFQGVNNGDDEKK